MELREVLGTLSGFAVLVGVGIAILQLRALPTWSKVAPLVRGYRDAANVHDYGLRFEALARALHARLDDLGEPHVAVD